MPNRPKILIVNDDPMIRHGLKRLLDDQGYKTHTGNNDKQAFDNLADEDFDLILLDIVEPNRNDYQAMDHMNRLWPDAPVIIMTDHASLESAMSALRKAAYDYLIKPFSDEKILRTTENALDHKRSENERKLAQEELRRNYDTQTVINSLLRHSLSDMRLEELLQRALELILSIDWLAFESQGSIFLVENGSKMLVMKAQSGLAEKIKQTCAKLPFGRCHCGRAAVTREMQFIDHIDDRHEIRYKGIIPHGHYCVPILYGDTTLGVINMYLREGHRRDEKEEEFLNAVANTLAGIIKRKCLEDELIQSERLAAIGQTVAGLAHCIKNILFGLEGGVYVVNKALKKNDRRKLSTGWEMVGRNIDKVSHLVFDLLSYSKERTPEYETCSPDKIAGEVCDLMNPRAKDIVVGSLKIIRDFDPNIGEMMLDPKGIHRCILNLVSNAVDACMSDQDEGKAHLVKVSTRRDKDGAIIFQVSDDGCGMDEEVKKQLFTSFFSTKGSKGTGLGLPVTQKIVQEHGGTLRADSEPGKGSIFTIRLPRKDQGE